MPTAEAHLATERASRYLAQLCGHLGRMSRMNQRPPGDPGEVPGDPGETPGDPGEVSGDHGVGPDGHEEGPDIHGKGPGGHREGRTPPSVQHVDWTEALGTVRFTDGQWTLRATADALTLRVDADDEESLRRLQAAIATRIEMIGRRDGLQVHWQRAAADTAPPTEQPP